MESYLYCAILENTNFQAFHDMPKYFSHFMKYLIEWTILEIVRQFTECLIAYSLPVTYKSIVESNACCHHERTEEATAKTLQASWRQ